LRDSKENLPVILEVPGVTVRSAEWNGMAVNHIELAKGSDFTPVLKGLKDDLCQCPHWGYILRGALHLRYKDGQEETANAGDFWSTAPGHTGWCDEDTEFVEFSPAAEYNHVVEHIKKQIAG
jgi:hypothetical protein